MHDQLLRGVVRATDVGMIRHNPYYKTFENGSDQDLRVLPKELSVRVTGLIDAHVPCMHDIALSWSEGRTMFGHNVSKVVETPRAILQVVHDQLTRLVDGCGILHICLGRSTLSPQSTIPGGTITFLNSIAYRRMPIP
jgi:hypothetical protein